MTKFEKYVAIFIAALIFFLAVFFSYKIGHRYGYKAGYKQATLDIQADTVTVVDTILIDKPVPEYQYIDKPIYIPIHDTTLIVKNDTTYIVLNREVVGYSDTDYRCEVSGVQPRLDWIEVYPKTTTVVKTVTEYSDYERTLSAFADGGASYAMFYAKVGFRYEARLVEPINYTLKAGYEWSSIGKGGFMEVGLSMPLWKK